MGMVAELLYCCMVDFISVLAMYDILYIYSGLLVMYMYMFVQKSVDLEFLKCINYDKGTVNWKRYFKSLFLLNFVCMNTTVRVIYNFLLLIQCQSTSEVRNCFYYH
jgi:hypothetical protein